MRDVPASKTSSKEARQAERKVTRATEIKTENLKLDGGSV